VRDILSGILLQLHAVVAERQAQATAQRTRGWYPYFLLAQAFFCQLWLMIQ